MKFPSTLGALLLVLVNECAAKKYYNHRLAKDTTGLWGARPSFIYEHPDDRESDNHDNDDVHGRTLKGSHNARRIEGEPLTFPVEESVDEPIVNGADDAFLYEDSSDLFYKAEGLDFFKKGINPEFFEWVNPDEIAPGAVTCGFMKPPLGSVSNKIFPTVEVYVCVLFAKTQPAKKGNLFVHCGGPSSLTDCSVFLLNFGDFSEDMLNTYNILSIDQRGLGRSWPSFIHEECSEAESFIYAENGTIIEAVYDPAYYNYTVDDPESIKPHLQVIKARIQKCWTCTSCDFFLNATQESGNITQFHFLEYSGTRQVAEDILRMTILINAPRMHFYGISYGTLVFATFATIFPRDVGIFVLDSCTSAVPDHYHQAKTLAVGINDRIDYIIYSCSARNLANPGSCPVQDMRQCMGDLNTVLHLRPGFPSLFTLGEFIQIMFANMDRAEELCKAAAQGNEETVNSIYEELVPTLTFDSSEILRQMGGRPESQPSFEGEPIYGNPNYPQLEGYIPLIMIQAMDRAGIIYDEDRFVLETDEINRKYPGAGTGTPAETFVSEYSTGFYWPKAIPLPPFGNSVTKGIIIGMLYDPATPYVWTQEMRNGFKNSHLLTSQAVYHSLSSADPDCYRQHVVSYFETGIIGFVDGQVCGSDFATTFDLAEVFYIYTEL